MENIENIILMVKYKELNILKIILLTEKLLVIMKMEIKKENIHIKIIY